MKQIDCQAKVAMAVSGEVLDFTNLDGQGVDGPLAKLWHFSVQACPEFTVCYVTLTQGAKSGFENRVLYLDPPVGVLFGGRLLNTKKPPSLTPLGGCWYLPFLLQGFLYPCA